MADKTYIALVLGTAILASLFLRQRKPFRATLAALTGSLWLILEKSEILNWLQSLGPDSFVEIGNASFAEVVFWLQTMQSWKWKVPYEKIAYLAIIIGILYSIKGKYLKKYRSAALFSIYTASSTLIAAGLYFELGVTATSASQSKVLYQNISQNFTHSLRAVQTNTQHKTNLIVYIGESTSTLNMSLYNYPIQTTPQLDRLEETDPNLFVLSNIYSAMTHTSPSLLEALSIPLTSSHQEPIYNQARLPLVDLLTNQGIPTRLISNQGRHGTWNMAGKVAFKSIQESIYSIDIPSLGNLEEKIQKPFDHDFFLEHLPQDLNQNNLEGVTFLHSTAGHGPYKGLIPPSSPPPKGYFWKDLDDKALFGNATTSRYQQIADHDTAIHYIDTTIASIIERIQQSETPFVFVYFSDHGESVFTNRGHDSARVTLEMLQVPFIVYFNTAAKTQNPALFESMQQLEKVDPIGTLGELSGTLLNILGIHHTNVLVNDKPIAKPEEIDSKTPTRDFFVRKKADKIKKLTFQPLLHNPTADTQSEVQNLLTMHSNTTSLGRTLCGHKANNIGTLLRYASVTNCIELDLVVSDQSLIINHPPEPESNLTLEFVLQHLPSTISSVWIDGKNINTAENCTQLQKSLAGYPLNSKTQLFVEFSNLLFPVEVTLQHCIQQLRNANIWTSFYIPTDNAVQCAEQGSNGAQCNDLFATIQLIQDSKLFSDISFDYRAHKPIEQFLQPKKSPNTQLMLNTWGISTNSAIHLDKKYRYVIPISEDPNAFL